MVLLCTKRDFDMINYSYVPIPTTAYGIDTELDSG